MQIKIVNKIIEVDIYNKVVFFLNIFSNILSHPKYIIIYLPNKKKILRTAEEKEKAVKRYLAGESATKIANEIDTSDDVIRKWVQKYNSEGIDGLKSKTGKHSNTSKNSGLYLRKPKNKIEELELEIMKKDIEIARLKKGYNVKGVGQEKEFVTTFNKNTK